MNVLIIDEDDDVRKIIYEILFEACIAAKSRSTVKDALLLLKDDVFDVVLLDRNADPRMKDNFKDIPTIREAAPVSALVGMAFTTLPGSDQILRAGGGEGFIWKPWNDNNDIINTLEGAFFEMEKRIWKTNEKSKSI